MEEAFEAKWKAERDLLLSQIRALEEQGLSKV
jgi:hypothetical protein